MFLRPMPGKTGSFESFELIHRFYLVGQRNFIKFLSWILLIIEVNLILSLLPLGFI